MVVVCVDMIASSCTGCTDDSGAKSDKFLTAVACRSIQERRREQLRRGVG
jgi:hypothetical protein